MGILGLGLTAVSASLYHTGLVQADSMVLKNLLIYGGLWLILTGVLDWGRNSLLGATAFISYGLFWLSLVAMDLLPAAGWGRSPQPSALAAYLGVWAMFSLVLFFGALSNRRMLAAVFGLLAVMLVFSALGHGMEDAGLKAAAGYVGLAGGLLALWEGAAGRFRRSVADDEILHGEENRDNTQSL